MSKVLFVKANNRPADQAITVQLYDAFLESYKASHPEDEVQVLDLFEEKPAYYDAFVIGANFKASQGIEVSAEEQAAVDLINRYMTQFLEAEKVVIAFPLWNFTVPAVLHTYFDYLSQAGKTFKYTPEGPVGLAGGKKVMLLHASGGVYSEGPGADVELAVRYVRSMLGFWGITDVEKFLIEGHNAFPDRAAQIVAEGLEKAKETAKQF
ncbi:FMN-dependent NADH-azoreductase [Paenibacillus kandeliae]|uniref:FMN-dependent NADH-azoreductase n=1 Tax=Paenibacillus kandeliae TaxID=3231269 RepID=UPI0034586289